MAEVITVLPTRGLIFAETLASLNRNGIYDPIIVAGRPIPEAQNECVQLALEEYSGYVLFVEDDMSFPEDTLTQMIKMDQAIVCVDYPMDNEYSTICRKGDEILWCGIGCTLVKRGVLAAMKDNWFDTSYSWKIKSENPFKLEKIDNPYKYGGLDINFCIKARELGFTIHQLPGVEAQHLRCDDLQKGQYNEGQQYIYALPEVSHRQQY